MKNILYVSAFIPQRNAGHAGGRVAFENLMALKDMGQVDAVVCSTEVGSAGKVDGMELIPQKKWALAVYMLKNLGGLPWRTLLSAPIIHTRLNLHAESVIVELLRSRDYEEVFVDFTQCLLLVRRAVVRAGKKVRVTACLHDIFAQRMIRSGGVLESVLTGLVCQQEQELLGSLDGVTTLSPKDRDLVQSLYSVTEAKVKPFAAPDWCSNVHRRLGGIDHKKIVFFGNFDRSENSLAARWFVDIAMPRLRSSISCVTLILVGTGSDKLAGQLGMKDVIGTGFIEDPSSYFSCCGCAIAPLSEGAGVKFKVLEALACGVPVLGTAVACEGIEPQPMLFHAERATFAEETIRILKMVASGELA